MSHIIFPKSIKFMALVVILLLSIYNLFTFSKTPAKNPQTKGAAIENTDNYELGLWEEFVKKNPSYLPGIKRINELKK